MKFCNNKLSLVLNTFSKVLIISVVIMLYAFASIAQNQLSVYKSLTSTYGLPSDYIYDIEFDKDGFLWMATPLGLIRYDGNTYKVLNTKDIDKASVEWNIRNLCQTENKIWYIAQNGGLFYYDKLNHSNKEVKLKNISDKKLSKNSFTFVFNDINKNLWLSIKEYGILEIDSETGVQTHYIHDEDNPNSIIGNNVTDICQDAVGNFWMSTDKGVCVLDYLNRSFTCFSNNLENENLLLSNKLQSVITDPAGHIWIGTAGSGLSKFDPVSLNRVDYSYQEENIASISNNYISDLFIDSNNFLWISTKNGLNSIDLNKDKVEIVRYKKGKVGGLTSNRINDVTQSPDGNIWVATSGGGINVIQNSESRFINKKFDSNQKKLKGLPITCIEDDNEGRIWIATLGEGVMVFSATGEYLSKLSKSINKKYIKGNCDVVNLHYQDRKMFFGSDTYGLYYIDFDSDSFIKNGEIQSCNLPELNKGVHDIFLDQERKKWVLTNRGAYCFFKGQLVDSLITKVPATFITQDYRGKIWIGTDGDGVWVYQQSNNVKQHYIHESNNKSSLIGDFISCIYEDNTGVMWIGTTDGGLCSYDRNYNKFSAFKHSNRIMSSSVFSIIEDDDEFLWVASEYGLLKIDHINKQSVLFGYGQGLLRNEFNSRAVLKDRKGNLFFGTENGLLSFNPRNVTMEEKFPKLKFTDFFVYNKSIFELSDTTRGYDFAVNSNVSLETRENYIGIEFAGLDLDYPEHIQFKYRLLGLEDEWVYSRSNNFISYINVPSGFYTFQLSSTNKDDIWNPEMIELEIEIKSPIYIRTWFVVLVVLVLSFIITSLIFIRLRVSGRMTKDLENKVNEKTFQLKESNQKLQQEVDERKSAEESAENANKTKSLFLANMSHEIRTPMNSIIGFTDLLTSLVKDDKQKHYLDSIKSSGRSLLILINDILDLSKIEAGKFEIEYQPVNLRALVEEIRQVFTLKCDEKDLLFHTDVDPKIPDNLILSDTRLRQIFVNIVGNAIKFTERGSVSINVKQIAAPVNTSMINLQIDIIDTGVGIPQEQQQNIFNAFQQQEGQEFSKYGGTGLGLTISKRLMELMGGKMNLRSTVGKGTTFSLFLNDVPVYTEDIQQEEEKEKSSLNDLNLSAISILIVDDSKANRNLIVEFLTPTGATLYEAGNGQEAYEKAKELIPSIIFLDIRMPVMNGLETAKALRSYMPTSEIPLVAFTASISYSESSKYELAGFNSVLLKPVQLDELADIIISLLGNQILIDKANDAEVEEDTGFENIRIVDLKAALDELNDIQAEWEFAKNNRFVNVVLEFSAKIIEIGETYSIKSIIRYGQQIRINAQSFDTEKMEKSLNAFPSMLEELNFYLND